ncbi:MAG: hypothetical protein R3C52_06055 [Hyphomonadaceae bacterium]
MTARSKLLIAWSETLPSDLRAAIERALDALLIEHADAGLGGENDGDDDDGGRLRMAVMDARHDATPPPGAEICVLAGPVLNDAARGVPASVLRIEAEDVGAPAKRWIALIEKLERRLDRPGLAAFAAAPDSEARRAWALDHAADPLARDENINRSPGVLERRLAEERRRSESSGETAQTLKRELEQARHDLVQAQQATNAERERREAVETRLARLEWTLDAAGYPLAQVGADLRGLVEDARTHAGRARLAAAEAARAADRHPDALAWPQTQAIYSGEARNRTPDGAGRMRFRNSGGGYAGEYVEGRRSGYGVGVSDDGHVWSGQWINDVAAGLGLLECPDGRRFEGRVSPDDAGEPRVVLGWWWPAPGAAGKTEAQAVQTLRVETGKLLPAT